MTNKDLRKHLKKIDETEKIDNISEIARLMKNIVINDKHMSIENKMKFMFLYYQLKDECNKNINIVLKNKSPKLSVLSKVKIYIKNKFYIH